MLQNCTLNNEPHNVWFQVLSVLNFSLSLSLWDFCVGKYAHNFILIRSINRPYNLTPVDKVNFCCLFVLFVCVFCFFLILFYYTQCTLWMSNGLAFNTRIYFTSYFNNDPFSNLFNSKIIKTTKNQNRTTLKIMFRWFVIVNF